MAATSVPVGPAACTLTHACTCGRCGPNVLGLGGAVAARTATVTSLPFKLVRARPPDLPPVPNQITYWPSTRLSTRHPMLLLTRALMPTARWGGTRRSLRPPKRASRTMPEEMHRRRQCQCPRQPARRLTPKPPLQPVPLRRRANFKVSSHKLVSVRRLPASVPVPDLGTCCGYSASMGRAAMY